MASCCANKRVESDKTASEMIKLTCRKHRNSSEEQV